MSVSFEKLEGKSIEEQEEEEEEEEEEEGDFLLSSECRDGGGICPAFDGIVKPLEDR